MSNSQSLAVGMSHHTTMIVETWHTVPSFAQTWEGFGNMPPVLATVIMIGLIEHCCVQAVRPALLPTQRTVGTLVDVSHLAATAVGMSVTATVELIEINGRSLRFRANCHDGADVIGEGFHQRAIVDLDRFSSRLAEKARRAGALRTL